MDIFVRPSSLGGHLRVRKFLPIFFFTVGNFSEADVSNLDPRWRRPRIDRCAQAQTGEGAQTGACGHRRVRARRQVRAGTDG